MRRAVHLAAALALAALVAAPAAAQRFDWDAVGVEFCRGLLGDDLATLRPLFTPELTALVDRALAAERARGRGAGRVTPAYLFQAYTNPLPECRVATRNVALVEIRRGGGRSPARGWTDYLVMVPLADGTTRVDDVLFATRRSDTLRTRLEWVIATP
jgi:hypothetical protein